MEDREEGRPALLQDINIPLGGSRALPEEGEEGTHQGPPGQVGGQTGGRPASERFTWKTEWRLGGGSMVKVRTGDHLIRHIFLKRIFRKPPGRGGL